MPELVYMHLETLLHSPADLVFESSLLEFTEKEQPGISSVFLNFLRSHFCALVVVPETNIQLCLLVSVNGYFSFATTNACV
jgi:hypothetical protein